MSTPTWSICHATYGRPQKAVAAMRMWFERAARPDEVEYIFAVNEDDEATDIALMRYEAGAWTGHNTYVPRRVYGAFPGSTPAWDAAAKASTGLVLIQASDDVEPPEYWDNRLVHKLRDALRPAPCLTINFSHGDLIEKCVTPTVVAVSDGYRKDPLQTIAICNRARYEQVGEFIHAGYRSVFSDDDFTIRAIADDKDGKCTLIDARDLTFTHRHHYHDKSVPWDPVYARGNSTEAYAQGQALFMKRNSHLVARGLKTW